MSAENSESLAFGVETFARRRVRLGYARVEYDAGRDVALEDLTAMVPCGTCTACCRGLPVALAAREPDAGLDVELVDGTRYLRQVDGHCAHLVNDRCTVYDRRPLSCRAFDCRDYAVARVAPLRYPLLVEAVKRWRLEVRAADDREAFAHIAALAHELLAAGRGMAEAIMTSLLLRKLPTAEALRRAGVPPP